MRKSMESKKVNGKQIMEDIAYMNSVKQQEREEDENVYRE